MTSLRQRYCKKTHFTRLENSTDFPNDRLVGFKVTTVADPVNSITCGLVEALSLSEIFPDLGPIERGENVALIEHLAQGATLAPQFEVTPN